MKRAHGEAKACLTERLTQRGDLGGRGEGRRAAHEAYPARLVEAVGGIVADIAGHLTGAMGARQGARRITIRCRGGLKLDRGDDGGRLDWMSCIVAAVESFDTG